MQQALFSKKQGFDLVQLHSYGTAPYRHIQDVKGGKS